MGELDKTKIIKERMPIWENWLLEKQAIPVLLIGMSDQGVTTLAPKGLAPADMIKIMEQAIDLLMKQFGQERLNKSDMVFLAKRINTVDWKPTGNTRPKYKDN